jgi:hypothetical protein
MTALEFQPFTDELDAAAGKSTTPAMKRGDTTCRFSFSFSLVFELAQLAVPVVATFLLQRSLDIITFAMARPRRAVVGSPFFRGGVVAQVGHLGNVELDALALALMFGAPFRPLSRSGSA